MISLVIPLYGDRADESSIVESEYENKKRYDSLPHNNGSRSFGHALHLAFRTWWLEAEGRPSVGLPIAVTSIIIEDTLMR